MCKKSSVLLALPLLFLAGCEVGPDYKAPKIDMPTPDKKVDVSGFAVDEWWKNFNSRVLDNLEKHALHNNTDIQKAVANVAMARASVDEAFASLLPEIGASGSGSKNFISTRGKSFFPGLSKTRHSLDYLTSVGMSYEIDLFGKYRRENEAARALLLSSEAARQAVILTVTAEVAKNYFLLRALDAKLAIARRTLNTRLQTHKAYKSRFLNGYCTELDLLRIEAEVSSVKSTVLNLEKAVAHAETAMSMLIGCSPRLIVERKTNTSQAIEKLKISAKIPAGIPSDILARRPDIASAEGQLIAANARIGVAKAAYFPSISLTSAIGYESNSLGRLFLPGADFWSFGENVSLPIFTGGKLKALNAAARANYEAKLADYKRTIQVAFKEVLDSLVSVHKNQDIVNSKTRQVNALKRSYELAIKQKNSGLIGLIDLLDVERGLLAIEIELVDALYDRLTATVDLCKALGGGWYISKLTNIAGNFKNKN